MNEAHAGDLKYPQVCMLIGAGIGVTPFAAVLRDLLHLLATWRKFVDQPMLGLKEMTKALLPFFLSMPLPRVCIAKCEVVFCVTSGWEDPNTIRFGGLKMYPSYNSMPTGSCKFAIGFYPV